MRNKHTGFVQTYTPDATMSWEQSIGWQARQALAWVEKNHPGELGKTLPFPGRIAADVVFYLRRPASAPKRVEYPLTGGDVDNLVKSVLDALQNVQVIGDDKTVTDLTVSKRFADHDNAEGVYIALTGWA